MRETEERRKKGKEWMEGRNYNRIFEKKEQMKGMGGRNEGMDGKKEP